VLGTAKNGERVSSSCVGCVAYVPGRSSSLGERARGGEDETMGSSRYIVSSKRVWKFWVEARLDLLLGF
jgi:hypothetical protein